MIDSIFTSRLTKATISVRRGYRFINGYASSSVFFKNYRAIFLRITSRHVNRLGAVQLNNLQKDCLLPSLTGLYFRPAILIRLYHH